MEQTQADKERILRETAAAIAEMRTEAVRFLAYLQKLDPEVSAFFGELVLRGDGQQLRQLDDKPLEIVRALASIAYLQIMHDVAAPAWTPATKCPKCQGVLSEPGVDSDLGYCPVCNVDLFLAPIPRR